MTHMLEVAFVQGTAAISKTISKVSKAISKTEYKGTYVPSHVLLILDEHIIFESSTYKHDDDNTKTFEKGTRILELGDIDRQKEKSIVKRCIISDNCDPYLALKYVAKASNYHYSYKSIFKFLSRGHLRKDTGKRKEEYICSGLVLDALREPIFRNNPAIQHIVTKYKGIDSNSVTPLDLFLTFSEAGFNFRETRGLVC